MKYSQSIGIAAVIAMLATCFLPWIFIPGHQITVTGFSAAGTNFGKPGLFNAILGMVMLLFFAIPAIWAKRTNVFIGAINLAWSFRNYILLTTCMMGECPEKKPALYALIVLSLIIQLMALLPEMPVPSNTGEE